MEGRKMPRIRGIHRRELSFLISFILLFSAPAWAQSGGITAAIDSISGNYRSVSQKIWEWREPGQEEFKGSALLMEELKKLGYKVTGDLKVPADLVKGGVAKTAFRAELKGKAPGSTITIMLEYDALSNGHACGHNLIATSGLLAAAGLAKVMADTPGRVLVIGTPDEERGSLGGGKVSLLEGGHFEGSDIVLITHPSDHWSLDQRLLASKRVSFTFKGKSAHAAASPHKGVNALRAVISTINNIDTLREHLRQDVRIHAIITKGGDRVNVVPEVAQMEVQVRALDTGTMEDAFRKAVICAKAAEMVTGAKLEYKEPRVFLTAPIVVPVYLDILRKQALAQGIPESELKVGEEHGSSDLGNVGYAYPTLNLSFKAAPEGISLHSDAMREAAVTDEAWKATVVAGKVVALTAYDLLNNPDKVKDIQQKFKELKEKENK